MTMSATEASGGYQWAGYTSMQDSEINTCLQSMPSSMDDTQNDQQTEEIYQQDPDNPALQGQGSC